jgi:hypothetical protein
MPPRCLPPIVFVFAAALVTGCNSARPPTQGSVAAPDARGFASSQAALPEGAGCSGAIARYRAVIDNDRAMGHVNPDVYGQIQGEMVAAQSACASGQEGRALALVRSSKARHGYPG